MLFYSDEAGYKVAEALAAKAKEGVKVRVMSDSGMSTIVRMLEKDRSTGTSNFADLKALFRQAGVDFTASDDEAYHLNNWQERRAKLSAQGVPEEFLLMQDAIQEGVTLDENVLDHRKILVFDGETAIVTGLNIGNRYLYAEQPHEAADDKLGELWHDGALLIQGPCVTELNRHFASKWMVRGGDVFDCQEHYRSMESYGTDVCTTYHYFPGMPANYIRDYYLHKLKTCRGPFIIENPYINDELFWETLANLDKIQARKITIINPYKARGNDYLQNESAIKCRMRKPFQRGVSFYSYSKRMTHWKIALDVANDEVFVGSYNLNHRSALHDFELNVLVESKQLAEKAKKMLETDLSESEQIKGIKEFYQHPGRHPSCLLLKTTEYFE
jgi:cardiolipin synthase